MERVSIHIHFFFLQEPTDLSVCCTCKSVIYSYMYVMYMQFGSIEQLKITQSEIKLCKSCFDILNLDSLN